MRVGYCVEGSTDRGFLIGLKDRWCPDMELVPGSFRGSSGLSLRREIPKICDELSNKGCDIMVFLTDANTDHQADVNKARTDQRNLVPGQYSARVLSGVTARNIECWLCADRDWIAARTGRNPQDFAVADPKGVFESALGITTAEKKEAEIALLVRNAPMKQWLARSRSFEHFYNDARTLSNAAGCRIPDERE